MANLFDYIKWRGDLSFKASPINQVDCAILAWLSYTEFDKYVPNEHSENAPSLKTVSGEFVKDHNIDEIIKKSVSFTKSSMIVLKDMAETNRYEGLIINDFERVTNIDRKVQFAAMTFTTENNETIVAFRGTDDTLVGWREDFDMAFTEVIPAQKMAAEYLDKVAKLTKGDIYVCGHSKGGNLAIYSVLMASKRIRNRVKHVYSYDGPGFYDSTDLGEAVEEVYAKTTAIVPDQSLVGMLLNYDKDYTVVPSVGRGGINQHDITTWQLLGTSFIKLPGLKPSSLALSKTIHNWLTSLDEMDREIFVDALFDVLMASDSQTLNDINSDAFGYAMSTLKTMNHLPKETRKFIRSIIQELIKQGGETIGETIKNEAEKLADKKKRNSRKVSKVLIDTPQ